MLANLDLIKFAKIAVTGGHIQNASAARGRGRRGTRRHGTLSAVSRDALLFRIVPGRETAVVGVDAVVALVGILYH